MRLLPHLNLEYLTGVTDSVFLNEMYASSIGSFIDDYRVFYDTKTNVLEIIAYDEENDAYPKSIWIEGLDVDNLYIKIKYAFDELHDEIKLK
jgi:hypothetical protein